MDNRGIETDPGWVNRRFAQLERAIEALRSERRAGSTTISDGDLTVEGGGSVRVQDGGDVAVNDGGDLTVNGGGGVVVNDDGSIDVYGTGVVRVWGDTSLGTITDGTFGVTTLVSGVPAYPSTLATPEGFLCDAGPGLGYVAFRVDAATGKGVVSSSTGEVTLSYSTTSDAANTRILLDGTIQQVVSSRRYKQDEEDVQLDPAAVLSLCGKTWRDRADVDADPDTEKRYVGFIAEDLHDAGLGLFVDYDEQDRPDAIQYDRLSVALLAVIKGQSARLDALESTVATLTKEP